MAEDQSDEQIDRWAADLFIDFAKRRGSAPPSRPSAARRTWMSAASSAPSWSAAARTTWSESTPAAPWRRRSSSCRRRSPGYGGSIPQARERLIDFLVDHREVMSYTP